jgi:copper chaperone CopZ
VSSVRAHLIGQRAGKTLIACLIAAASNAWLDIHAETTTAPAAKPGKPSMIQTSEAAKPASYNAKALRRLDFKVKGKSCAVCLMGIQRKFKSLPGVVKAAVMLKPPYGAVVIYDSSKISMQELIEKAKKQEKEVRVEQVTDFPVQKIPTILIPLYGIPKSPVADPNAGSQK